MDHSRQGRHDLVSGSCASRWERWHLRVHSSENEQRVQGIAWAIPLEGGEMSEVDALGVPITLSLARGAAQQTSPDQKSASGALPPTLSPVVVDEVYQRWAHGLTGHRWLNHPDQAREHTTHTKPEYTRTSEHTKSPKSKKDSV